MNDSNYAFEHLFCRSNKALMSKYERGLCVKDPQIMEGVFTAYSGGTATGFDQPIIPIVSNVGAVTWEAGTAAKYP
jgi:hypothetical protein